MPMTIDPAPMESLISRIKWKYQTSYGHSKPFATKCGHLLHASAPKHVPLCPSCVAEDVKQRMNVALKELLAEGGLSPLPDDRDRSWLRARIHYEIAQNRQTKARMRDQLRLEREQVWEEAHARFDSHRKQAAVAFQDPAECPVCAALNASYPTSMPEALSHTEVAWWEKPSTLIADHTLVSRKPYQRVPKVRLQSPLASGSHTFRRLIQASREELRAQEESQKNWEVRYRIESAVRRKHSLGEEFHANPEFWDSPLPGLQSRRYYDSAVEDQRLTERRARGNRLRPKPPRSSLSYSESSADLTIDESMLERMRREEELEELQRQSRKVAEEVAYLYFVGQVDGMVDWREDYLRSDRHLVYRTSSPSVSSLNAMSVTDSSGDDDESEYDEECFEKMDLELGRLNDE